MDGSTPRELSRRGFLILGGGAAAIVGLNACGSQNAVDQLPIDASSAVLAGGFPRVIAFRQTERLVPLNDYETWAELFAPFSGIIGKALQEERTEISGPQTVEYFNEFKQQFPEKLVLLHHNGRARRPTFETEGWSAGWWLYREGSVLESSAEAADTVLQVRSTTNFKLRADMEGHVGDDLVIAEMGSDGRPDFTKAEHVRLVEIDATAKKLTVRRGQYGSSPLAFSDGAYLGRHVYAGPWSAVDDRVWLYNISTTCPRDPSGRRVVDVLIEQFAEWFAPDGVLASFDGVQLDVFQLTLEDRRGVDADCDGRADLANQGGVDTYLQGQIELTARLRQVLGPNRYLITDGAVGQQPDTASVNGIELEGFPKYDDYDIARWSQAIMGLELWRRRGAQPRLSYPLFKFAPPHDYPVSFNRFRLALAGSLATNSAISWFNEPGGSTQDPSNSVVIYDEFVGGSLAKAGWLGLPRGETIHLAERKTDVLAGAGVAWSSSFVASFDGAEVQFAVQSASTPILVVTRRQAAERLSFSIPAIDSDGPDVVLAFDVLGVKRAAYAPTIGRQCTVTVSGNGGELSQSVTAPTTWFHVVLGFHGVGPGPLNVTVTIDGDVPLKVRALKIFAAPDAIARAFVAGAMFANPSAAEYAFDVASIFPRRRFRRLTGSLDQDPHANDGSEVGSTLTLGPLDALVVRSV